MKKKKSNSCLYVNIFEKFQALHSAFSTLKNHQICRPTIFGYPMCYTLKYHTINIRVLIFSNKDGSCTNHLMETCIISIALMGSANYCSNPFEVFCCIVKKKFDDDWDLSVITK